ncbi:preprotein translocase subunit SecG [Asticcacaulis sp. SL142]|uniref:preprotein translocase subunit SecG n=1 Tax=Asticcacaulis sp. SL142 TaxID=2995155 RepID=UPI00226CE982|nr:preprotein translocase subunit SecG [Asticcacaulis sp. SL142]WAC48905.1 preprotein translocase subunit SecG [Asticcacaulis sp. SL142]
MLFGILLTVQIIICLALVGLVLIQRSEGGALGMGGSPSGFMSARGAGNFLTRATSILAILFFANSIGLTIVGNMSQRGSSVVDQVGEGNINLDAANLPAAAPAAPAGATASSAAAPSLTELPRPSAQVITPSAPQPVSKPVASVTPPSTRSATQSLAAPGAAPANDPIATQPAQ